MRRKRSMFWKVAAAGAAVLALMTWMAFPATGGWVTTHALGGGPVAVTNDQQHSVWAPVAVLLRFDAPASTLVAVARESQGNSFLLGMVSVTNAGSVVWVPETGYPFVLGDVLRVSSVATNGVVQVIRTGM